jgi:hypothetical protein
MTRSKSRPRGLPPKCNPNGFQAPAEHNAMVRHQLEAKARKKRMRKATLEMQKRARALA